MVKFLKFASETPNKSKAFGFAATKRWSTSVTTTASRALASNFRKSFSLVRSALRSLRGLSTTRRPSLVSVVCACPRCNVTCSEVAKSCVLHLAILPLVRTTALWELASKSFALARSACCSLSATFLPRVASAFCACRRCSVTCSEVAKSCVLHLAILPLVRTTALWELASKSFCSCAKCLLQSFGYIPSQ